MAPLLAAQERSPHGLHPFYPNVGGLAEVPFAKALTRIRPAGSHGVHNSGAKPARDVIQPDPLKELIIKQSRQHALRGPDSTFHEEVRISRISQPASKSVHRKVASYEGLAFRANMSH